MKKVLHYSILFCAFFVTSFFWGVVEAQNIFSGEPVQWVGSPNGYSTEPYNSDYRTTVYRRISVATGTPSDGRGQWATTINVQNSGGNIQPANITGGGGGGGGWLLISGPSTNRFQNKWNFNTVSQAAVNGFSDVTLQGGGQDMGVNMSTAGYYTYVMRDNGYNSTNVYIGYTSNPPVAVTHNSNQFVGGSLVVSLTTSATPSSSERLYVRYRVGTNAFNASTGIVEASGSGSTWSATLPAINCGETVYYYAFTSTRTLTQLNGDSEQNRSLAVLRYADNSGNNFSATRTTSTWYLDADLDGYYTGEPVVSCDSPGAGYTTTVNGGGDCDDTNGLVNPGATEVCFDGVDSNCSGNDSDACPVVVNITNYCGGTLPIINAIIKCNVPNLSAYGSGFTLGYRFRVTNTVTNTTVELDRSVPNFNLTMTDIYTYNTLFTIQVAAVVNGYAQSYLGATCSVTTPAIPTNQVVSTTCGETLAALNSRIHVSTVFGSIHYRFRIELSDAPTTYEYVELSSPSMRLNNLTTLPLNFGKTYLIAVQSLVNVNGEEVYSDFGAECAVSTPAVSAISVSTNQCGQELETITSRIFINSVPNATLYRYRVALASNPSVTEDITSTFTSFRLNGLTGIVPLLHASDYLVSVQVEVTIDGNVFLSDFSTPCIISTPAFPESGIQASQCSNGNEDNEGPYAVSSLDEQIYAEFVSGASYRFLLERFVNDELVYSEEITRPVNWFRLSMFNSIPGSTPLVEGATYSISVGLNINGEGPYGKDCSLVVPAAMSRLAKGDAPAISRMTDLFTAVAYPNPFADSFNLDIKANATAPITIVVYDMMGRLLESKDIIIDQANTTNIGGNYPTGVYNVVVTQGEDVKMVRVVKQ